MLVDDALLIRALSDHWPVAGLLRGDDDIFPLPLQTVVLLVSLSISSDYASSRVKQKVGH